MKLPDNPEATLDAPTTLQDECDSYITVDAQIKELEKDKKKLKASIVSKLKTDEEVIGTEGKKKVVLTERRIINPDANLIKVLQDQGEYDKVLRTEIDTDRLRAVMELNSTVEGAVSYKVSEVLSVKNNK